MREVLTLYFPRKLSYDTRSLEELTLFFKQTFIYINVKLLMYVGARCVTGQPFPAIGPRNLDEWNRDNRVGS